MQELKDTVNDMLSNDYKERFRAEYQQLRIRIEKLGKTILDYQYGSLPFQPACPIELLQKQLAAMEEYLIILVERASIEEIEL